MIGFNKQCLFFLIEFYYKNLSIELYVGVGEVIDDMFHGITFLTQHFSNLLYSLDLKRVF